MKLRFIQSWQPLHVTILLFLKEKSQPFWAGRLNTCLYKVLKNLILSVKLSKFEMCLNLEYVP